VETHSVLLLTYNRIDLLRARIEEIKKHFNKRQDTQLFVFDNGGTDTSYEYLESLLNPNNPQNLSISFHREDTNIGFGRAFNKAAEMSCGNFLYFVSNDVQIYGDFINPIESILKEVPRSLICNELIDWEAGWNQFGNAPPITYPAGHFLACTREVWNELGGFDPHYYPHDYEDIDLGMTAQSKGISLIRLEYLPVKHLVAGTIGYNPQRMKNTIKQRARFAEKWSLPNEPERP